MFNFFIALFNSSNKRKGFTLIELLVVIAIIGILATALIATIDPFEQIKKANDANMKELATEFNDANTRYYSDQNALPWWSAAQNGSNCYTGGNTLTTVALSSLVACLNVYVTAGELKAGFTNSSYLSTIFATNPDPFTGNLTDTGTCFLPTSKAEQRDINTKYNQNGSLAPAGSCKSQGGANSCYWCTQ